jgi:hypothetical protein
MAITLHDATGEDTQTEIRQGKRSERDETQRHLDGRVAQVKAEWEGKGKPKPERAPFHRFTVAKAERAEAKQMVRRAGNLHKVDIVFWKDAPNADGTVTVKFTVADKPAKASGNGQTPAQPQSQPQAQTEEQQRKGRFGR